MAFLNFRSQETKERKIYFWVNVVTDNLETKEKFLADLQILTDEGIEKVELAFLKLVASDDKMRYSGLLQVKVRAYKSDIVKVFPGGSQVRGIVKDDVNRALAALDIMITPGSDLEVVELGFLTRQGGRRKR